MTAFSRLKRRLKKKRQLDEILARATETIISEKLYLKDNLRCVDVAKSIGTNRTYLWQALGRHGLGFQEYLSKFRVWHFIENARMYMGLQCAEIAERCGFSDPKPLNRYLKQMFGVSLVGYMKLLEKTR